LFQSTGWILLWTLAQSNAHQQAQKTIAGEDVTYEHLRISVSQLRAYSINRREIRINGALFDIKSQHIFGDSVQLELYRDHHEESVVQRIHAFFQSQSDASGILFHNLWGTWLEWNYLLPSLFRLIPKTVMQCRPALAWIDPLPARIFLDNIAPPPKKANLA
jgi:hypothetical protein